MLMTTINLLKQDVRMDTETLYQVNGDINVFACPWNPCTEPLTEGAKRSYPARITVMENGDISVRAVPDLRSGRAVVDLGVRGVLELLENHGAGGGVPEFVRLRDCALHSGRPRCEDDLRAVRGRELAAERFSWQSVERRISVAMQVALAGAGMV